MGKVVLDASALLVLLNDESGSASVEAVLPGAAISAVNLSEVVAKLADRSVPLEIISTALLSLGLEVHPFDQEMAFVAGSLRPKTRSAGLSFGDRGCLALALLLSRTVLTADKSWKNLRLGVKIRLVR